MVQDEDRCCETGKLKTEDNNWEKGQVNYFVGFQMGDCADFNLDGKGNITFDFRGSNYEKIMGCRPWKIY